jgi:hypothetical protein
MMKTGKLGSSAHSLIPAAKPGVEVTCHSCEHIFAQDPPFSVPCRACGAKVGQYCKRPSGHSGPMVAFHAVRDIDALSLGYYDHDESSASSLKHRRARCGPNSNTPRSHQLIGEFFNNNRHLDPLQQAEPSGYPLTLFPLIP